MIFSFNLQIFELHLPANRIARSVAFFERLLRTLGVQFLKKEQRFFHARLPRACALGVSGSKTPDGAGTSLFKNGYGSHDDL
jgi:hypothetical protein